MEIFNMNQSIKMKMIAYLKIIRFPATAITAVLVGLLAISHATKPLDTIKVVFASFTYFLLSGAGFTINDYFDLDIDRVNKPDRPLPAGLINPQEAILLYLCMFFGSIVLSLFVNQVFAIIAISNALILSAYSAYFKRHGGIVGNILMGMYAALVILSGYSASNGKVSSEIVIYAVPLFLYMVGTQIIMGIEDIKGDRLHGVLTLPVIIGIKKSLFLALFIMLLAILLMILKIKNEIEIFFIFIIIALYLYLVLRITKSPTPAIAKKFRKYMAISMILYVIIVILKGGE